MMNPAEVEKILNTMIILVDTREHPTAEAKRRWERFGVPYERVGLKNGDYTAKFILEGNESFTLEDICLIERKMSVGEICGNFCNGRDRFTREFERIKEKGAKTYLLIEGATWENIYNGKYNSKMTPKSLVSSLTAWLARYNVVPIFCKPETTPKLIRELLYREAKEYFEKGGYDVAGTERIHNAPQENA